MPIFSELTVLLMGDIFWEICCCWDSSFRQDHPGTISGRQLGEAAHRLVDNSLQVRANSNRYSDQMHGPPRSYATTHGQPLSSYQNNRHHGHERNGTEAARTGYPVETAQRHHRSSHLTTEGNQHGHSYGQPYASPTVQNSSHRSRHQHESDPYNRSYPRHERNNQSTSQNSEHLGHAYYPARVPTKWWKQESFTWPSSSCCSNSHSHFSRS